MISYIVYKFFDLLFLVLLVYVFLTWIPSIKWENEPFRSLKGLADLIFLPFRKLIPPIGVIDISPIAAFFALGILRWAIIKILLFFGL